jgi:hypothetical protein
MQKSSKPGLNRARLAIFTKIRMAYRDLSPELGQAGAITKIQADPDLNPLGYSFDYLRDIVYRIDPTIPRKKR